MKKPTILTLRQITVIAAVTLALSAVAIIARAHHAQARADRQQAAAAQSPDPAGGRDWIGFHNGGTLDGVGSAISPPPMKLRWSVSIKELEAADPPAPPATAPAGATTAPATVVSHGSGHFEAGAAIVGGVVYIADTAGAVRAIDAANAHVRWTFHDDDGFETMPLVLGNRVFLGSLGGTFHAIAADSGKELWKFDAGGSPIHASANYLVPNQSRIVFATDGADIFCLDAATGKQIWNGKSGDRVNGVPAVSDGSVLVSGCDSQLRALKGADGIEEFSADLGAVCPGSTAVAGGNLVMGTDQGRVLCISAKTHQQLWLFSQIREGAMVYSSPAIADGIVVLGARDSRVYGLELSTGKELWDYTTRGDVDSSPAISNGRVYVGSKDKKLYVLDLKTGKEQWSFTAGRGITASPAIGDGVLVIADEGGHLFCLE